jgi:tripartite-type tricarboxylate transporter receptor subunit TctC
MKINLVVLFISILGLSTELALAQGPFYQDKTITVVLGGPPAGSADLRTRAVISLLRKYIPGSPTSSCNICRRAEGGRRPTTSIESHALMD